MSVRRSIGLRLLNQERRPAMLGYTALSLLPSRSSRKDFSEPDTSVFVVLLSSDLNCFQRDRVRRKISTTKPG